MNTLFERIRSEIGIYDDSHSIPLIERIESVLNYKLSINNGNAHNVSSGRENFSKNGPLIDLPEEFLNKQFEKKIIRKYTTTKSSLDISGREKALKINTSEELDIYKSHIMKLNVLLELVEAYSSGDDTRVFSALINRACHNIERKIATFSFDEDINEKMADFVINKLLKPQEDLQKIIRGLFRQEGIFKEKMLYGINNYLKIIGVGSIVLTENLRFDDKSSNDILKYYDMIGTGSIISQVQVPAYTLWYYDTDEEDFVEKIVCGIGILKE